MEDTNTIVWVPDEKQVWRQARIVAKPSEFQVQVQLLASKYDERENEIVEFDVRQISKLAGEVANNALPICNTFEKLGVEDMCTLNHLHEPAVLKNLELRHAQLVPYTYTGQICIAVNPYKWMKELYTEDLYQQYLQQPRDSLPPHPFALSATAYTDMREHGIEQSILVSGESGAGKTETVKIMMNHLASISGGGDRGSLVIDQVLKSNPLLEAFGNAKTKRNDNSSRFGKFAQLQFDQKGYLVGARCETYLLEKSRVINQSPGERNYHIFYQIFALDENEKSKLLLLPGTVDKYRFVKVGLNSKIDDKDDIEYLKETQDAMNTIGIASNEQYGIFEIISAILNMGEVQFVQESAEKCIVQSKPTLQSVATLLQTNYEALEKSFCERNMSAGGEKFIIPLNAEQSADLRDAFAKGVYSQLFDWLVHRINNAICAKSSTVKSHIGLLDIFGFESFEHNSFEQLCINYANEKLQQKFNSDIFKTVQKEYIEEGIPLDLVTFEDNQPILDLIEGKLGIVTLLNEEILMVKGTDSSFVSKVVDSFQGHKNFEKIKFSTMQFKIIHYAGEVVYDGSGFLEKNKDTLPTDFIELLSSSASQFIKDVFNYNSATNVSGVNKKSAANSNRKMPLKPLKNSANGPKKGFLVGNTIAGAFRKQLSELMDSIAKTSTQYVRCIKPNANKSATEFNRLMVVDQLRCAGVIAAIRISRAAFPNRLSLSEFQARFVIICPSLRPTNQLTMATLPDRVFELLQSLLPDNNDVKTPQNSTFAIGKSKIYFSSGLLQYLEDQRTIVLAKYAITIQKVVRQFVCRRRFVCMKTSAIRLQSIVKMYICQQSYQQMRVKSIRIQSVVRMVLHRKKYTILLAQQRENENVKRLTEESNKRFTGATDTDFEPNEEEEPVDESSDDEHDRHNQFSANGNTQFLEQAALRVSEAENAALEAQKAAIAAIALNKELQTENEQLKYKLSSYLAEHADAELLRENDRLKREVITLQSRLVRAQEVSLISAKVVDSRMTQREGRQFVEYKLQIETNSRGTLYVWHRYSTFRNLATTLQTKNGYKRKDIPDLPNKQLFGNFSEKIIQDRIEKLNHFLEAATNADYLQWGIRVDQDTCVYKRRTRASSGSIDHHRMSMASTHSSPTSSSRMSISSKFSFRRNS